MNVQLKIQQSIKRVRASPKQILEKARRGSIPDLKDLANFWQEVPELLRLGILDVFFHHLDVGKAFAVPSEENERSPIAECAFYSLIGLCKAGEHFLPGAAHHRDPVVLRAWPGIFKWSAFFVTTRVTSSTPRPAEERRSTMDAVGTVWYCLSRADGMREVIATTKGTVEIATQLWVLDEEIPHSGPQFIGLPCVAAALDRLLVDRAATDRALAAGDGNADALGWIAMRRARSALGRNPLDPVQIAIYLGLLSHLSCGVDNPLRYAVLQAGGIPVCTRAAGELGRALDAGGSPGFLDGMVAAFGYLVNCLESTEGATWVVQSVTADLLIAFADCSPHFGMLDAEDCDMVCSLLKDILPTHLVYRSVVLAVHEGLQRLQAPQLKRLQSSMANKVWADFRRLAEERHMVVLHAAAMKGKAMACDNVQCHKIDAKNTFRKCSGCSTTLYCSKECQTIAWKEGGHRSMCKMKQQERREGKAEAISKADVSFLHSLSTRDARHYLPSLRRFARTKHPTLRPGELLIHIDYTVVPPTYTVVPLSEAATQSFVTGASSANAGARGDALIERARANPERFGLIQSRIVNGAWQQLVLSVVTGGFWDGDEEDGEGEDETLETDIDVVDAMMARTALNWFLADRGEEPTF
ncbi:hypothetical protein DFH07DRAFT_806830 [Mycena maculata]|uniref:MYND-type domain-containing protein n=1 Tax=Mycena maculata TaxID=230809 RepID=A0AAD7JP82_9AGAR|nr:hypothetical protein DFH07DRAFT_806830 [Mycena maculata]